MAYGLIFIEVCDANLACRPDLFELEHDFPSVSVMETPCMSECELCAQSPYVFIDGDLVATDSPEDLIDQLKAKVQQTLSRLDTDS